MESFEFLYVLVEGVEVEGFLGDFLIDHYLLLDEFPGLIDLREELPVLPIHLLLDPRVDLFGVFLAQGRYALENLFEPFELLCRLLLLLALLHLNRFDSLGLSF